MPNQGNKPGQGQNQGQVPPNQPGQKDIGQQTHGEDKQNQKPGHTGQGGQGQQKQ